MRKEKRRKGIEDLKGRAAARETAATGEKAVKKMVIGKGAGLLIEITKAS